MLRSHPSRHTENSLLHWIYERLEHTSPIPRDTRILLIFLSLGAVVIVILCALNLYSRRPWSIRTCILRSIVLERAARHARHSAAEKSPSNINEIEHQKSMGKLGRVENGRLAFCLLQALYDSDVDEIKSLLDNGPGPDFRLLVGEEYMSKWIIPLHRAVLTSLEVTRLLLDYGATVGVIYLNSRTALQRVPWFCRDDLKLPMMQLLIDYGAEVNAKPGVHGTALIAAINDHNPTLVHCKPHTACDHRLYRRVSQGRTRVHCS